MFFSICHHFLKTAVLTYYEHILHVSIFIWTRKMTFQGDWEPMDWEDSDHFEWECKPVDIKPVDIKPKDQGPSEACAICLASLSEPADVEVTFPSNPLKEITTTECQHKFHRVCLDRWLKERVGVETCPICRAIINTKFGGSLTNQQSIFGTIQRRIRRVRGVVFNVIHYYHQF